MRAFHQEAGQAASAQTARARRGVRNPGERANGFDVQAAGVVKVFRKPEQVEIPGGIAEEFRGYNTPKLAEPEQVAPWQGNSPLTPSLSTSEWERGNRWQPFCERRPRWRDVLWMLQAGMFFGRKIKQPPPEGPCEAESAREDKYPAPLGVTEHQGNQRRGDDAAHGSAGVDDAHGRGSLGNREPLGDRPGRSGEPAAFARAEQQPAGGEHAGGQRQTLAGTGQRPKQHT